MGAWRVIRRTGPGARGGVVKADATSGGDIARARRPTKGLPADAPLGSAAANGRLARERPGGGHFLSHCTPPWGRAGAHCE